LTESIRHVVVLDNSTGNTVGLTEIIRHVVLGLIYVPETRTKRLKTRKEAKKRSGSPEGEQNRKRRPLSTKNMDGTWGVKEKMGGKVKIWDIRTR
jgi:hypothetical protein